MQILNCVKWDGTFASAAFISKTFSNAKISVFYITKAQMQIKTPVGIVNVLSGDFIFEKVNGEYFVSKPWKSLRKPIAFLHVASFGSNVKVSEN